MSVLSMEGVRLVRGGKPVLDDVTWQVAAGQRWVVLGPNGAGKSTLLELASTYEVPSRGRIHVLGYRVGRTDLRDLRRLVGYAGAPLAKRLRSDLTALDAVLTGPRATLSVFRQTFDDDERDRAGRLLSELGIAALADRRVGHLSEGERQRVQLARTLMTDADLLLLDEPTAGLDLGGREQLVARLGALDGGRPRAAVLVTHHLEEIPASATHALLLRGGRVMAAGPIGQTVTSAALSACFGVDLQVASEGGRWWVRAAGGGR
jgi:iron complex transport system ATP-binding protein